ncbi:hypothetical protein JD77_01965 [Micromonospora olivasterospora]|uniref:Uncharacterized protein n=1 Tax=Micromonospora olivasterospora TaxID=1880 RepID=A0A562I8M8_MICOL|nr:hypothetical protein JD77_01965 [Micromonospora olivasterospora]
MAGPAGLNRDRVASTSSRSPSSSTAELVTRRTVPRASERVGCWAWGSHLTHSHSGRRSGPAQTAISSSSGAWNTASWVSTARASACASGDPVPARTVPSASCRAGSPRTYTRAKLRSDSATGRSGTTEYASRNRRSASAVIGSNSSSGRVTGGTSGVASVCGPTPTRTTAKSGSVGRRSQTRWLSTVDQSRPGSGWR